MSLHAARCSAGAQRVRSLVASGRLGSIVRFDARIGVRLLGATVRKEHRRTSATGGVLADHGTDVFALLISWLGPLAPIALADDSAGGVEAEAIARVTTLDGAPGTVVLSRLRSLPNSIVLTATKGRIEFDVDWSLLEKHADIHRFLKHLIRVRLQRDASQEEYSMSLNQLLKKGLIKWHGIKLFEPDWSNESHSIAFTIQSLGGDMMMHSMLNAYYGSLEFELPELAVSAQWKRWIDTSLDSPDDICGWNEVSVKASDTYLVQPRSVVILIAKL